MYIKVSEAILQDDLTLMDIKMNIYTADVVDTAKGSEKDTKNVSRK